MINIISDLFQKNDDSIWNDLNIINSKRVRLVLIILLIPILLLFFIDFYNYKKGLWINYGYILLFYTHIILSIGLFIFWLIYYINKINPNPFFYKFYTIGISFFVLNITAFISGWVDQMIHGQITVYTMGCFLIAFLFYLEPKNAILLFLQSYLFFIICLNIIQKNDNILQGYYINTSFIILLVCFVSISISKLVQKEYVYKYKLEELVKERSNELIEKQKEVNRLQQLNLIGELSAGIAHEIRNPMTVIRGFLQLLGDKDYNVKDKPHFELMIQELDRTNLIITEFLSLSKDKEINLEKKSLNFIISRLASLIEANLKANQTLKLDLGEIPELLLAENEIHQIILNLTNNGFESMPTGGCLTIKTYQLNDKVVLEIQDEGKGIEPELLDKIGTPFYTTKETGTGLGLAVSYNIINRHSGKLEIESSSKGSSFRVIFNIAYKKSSNLFSIIGEGKVTIPS